MNDINAAASLARKLWPDNEMDDLIAEFSEIISLENAAVFILEQDGRAVGFAQCQLRHDYVEGTEASPVGYLEGIFVEEKFRGRGHAVQLLEECEKWSRSMGCTEFASDCEVDNEMSLRFHLKHGFIEANRIICFAKKI